MTSGVQHDSPASSGASPPRARGGETFEYPADLIARVEEFAVRSGLTTSAASAALIERGLCSLEVAGREGQDHALRKSVERFGAVLQSFGDAFYALDGKLRFQYASQAALDLWGKSLDELLGREFVACFPQAVGSDAFEAHLRVISTGIAERVEVISPVPGNWVEVDLAPTKDGGLWVALRDIRARKAAELAMIESEERLRSAVEVGRLGLWDMDVKTGASHWSDRYFKMQGYEIGSVAPSYEAWLARIHPEDRAAAEAAVIQARETGEDYVSEYRALFPDGSVQWRSARGRFFYDEAGEPTRMIGAATDITDRREWEERQKALVAELQHRTGNLMAVVQAMALLTARRSDNLEAFLERFLDRLSALARVQRLLSRLEEGDRVTFDDLLCTELSALHGDGKQIETTGQSGIRLKSSTVQTLGLALHELGTNAVKYGALAQSTGLLSVSWELYSSDGKPWLHVDWRETGVIMPLPGAKSTGTGQGRRLLEIALPRQFNAKTTYSLGSDGVHCTIDVPLLHNTDH